MERNIIINEFGNPAKNFGIILKNLEEIAERTDTPIQETIRLFILDLQNLSNEEYEKNIQDINVNGKISPVTKNSLIAYLNKSIKKYNELDKKRAGRKKQDVKKQELKEVWSSIESEAILNKPKEMRKEVIEDLILKISEGTAYAELKKEQKSYVLKKLKELEMREKKEKENKEKNISNKWNAIVRKVDKEASESGKSKIEIWDMIAETVLGKNKKAQVKISVPDEMKDKVRALIEEQEEIEGKEYYEAVKRYTQNFEFLTGFRGISFALNGHRKFSQPEYSRMFEGLISRLREHENVEHPETEEQLLKRVLSDELINTYYGKKIIAGRIERIEKDRYKAYVRE